MEADNSIKSISNDNFNISKEILYGNFHLLWLTKYVVGAKANPPKNPRRPSKKGNVIAMNIVNAEKGKKKYCQYIEPK